MHVSELPGDGKLGVGVGGFGLGWRSFNGESRSVCLSFDCLVGIWYDCVNVDVGVGVGVGEWALEWGGVGSDTGWIVPEFGEWKLGRLVGDFFHLFFLHL